MLCGIGSAMYKSIFILDFKPKFEKRAVVLKIIQKLDDL